MEFPTVVHLHAIENLPHQSIAWRHCLLNSTHNRDVNIFDLIWWTHTKMKKRIINWKTGGYVPRFVCQYTLKREERIHKHIQKKIEKSGKCNLALDYDKWWYGWSVEYVCAFAERMAQGFVVDRSASPFACESTLELVQIAMENRNKAKEEAIDMKRI